MKLQRRKFLGSTLGLTGATLLPSFLKAGSTVLTESKEFYLMQSGNERDDSIVMWGLLEVSNPVQVASDLENIKLSNNFFARVNYSSNNKFKEPICNLFYNYFEESDMKLYVKLTSNADASFKDVSPSDRQATKVNFIQELNFECDI